MIWKGFTVENIKKNTGTEQLIGIEHVIRMLSLPDAQLNLPAVFQLPASELPTNLRRQLSSELFGKAKVMAQAHQVCIPHRSL